jgi:hypothetical protein
MQNELRREYHGAVRFRFSPLFSGFHFSSMWIDGHRDPFPNKLPPGQGQAGEINGQPYTDHHGKKDKGQDDRHLFQLGLRILFGFFYVHLRVGIYNVHVFLLIKMNPG